MLIGGKQNVAMQLGLFQATMVLCHLMCTVYYLLHVCMHMYMYIKKSAKFRVWNKVPQGSNPLFLEIPKSLPINLNAYAMCFGLAYLIIHIIITIIYC